MSDIFTDKVVIITGSNKGIGKATAIAFAKEGSIVIINGRDEQALQKTLEIVQTIDARAIGIAADISKPESAKKIIDKTIETFGRIDILINNAGISMRGYLSELDPVVFQKVFDSNVMGTINTTIPAIPHIRKTEGSIIFISSLAGIRGLPGMSAYSSSKMSLKAIADSLRIEESGTNIHVGLIMVAKTEIDEGKTTLSKEGRFIPLKYRTDKAASLESVYKEIFNNIKKRKYVSILSPIGKLNAFTNAVFPRLGEKILIRYKEYFEKNLH